MRPSVEPARRSCRSTCLWWITCAWWKVAVGAACVSVRRTCVMQPHLLFGPLPPPLHPFSSSSSCLCLCTLSSPGNPDKWSTTPVPHLPLPLTPPTILRFSHSILALYHSSFLFNLLRFFYITRSYDVSVLAEYFFLCLLSLLCFLRLFFLFCFIYFLALLSLPLHSINNILIILNLPPSFNLLLLIFFHFHIYIVFFYFIYIFLFFCFLHLFDGM